MRNTKIPYVTDIRIRLSWDAPDDDSVTGYQILRRRPTEGEHALSVYVPDTGSAVTSYTDTGVDAGTKYVYRVKAINEAGGGTQLPPGGDYHQLPLLGLGVSRFC